MTEAHAWNERLDLGHEAMDHDHHLQIALLSALAEAVEQGRPWMARRLTEQLVKYSTVHFGSEELLMEAGGYRGLDAHAGEHKALLAAMRGVEAALDGADARIALDEVLTLRASLAGHIAAADRKLAEGAAQ